MAQRIDEIKDNFKEYLGDDYKFEARILKAQDFGVPQNRERLIFIGNRLGVSPADIFNAINAYRRQPFTLGDALRGLPHLEARKVKNASDVEEISTGLTERKKLEAIKILNDLE